MYLCTTLSKKVDMGMSGKSGKVYTNTLDSVRIGVGIAENFTFYTSTGGNCEKSK